MTHRGFCFSLLYLWMVMGTIVQAASRVKITNNGYSDLVIAFQSEMPASEGEPLIAQIKNLFTSGSRALYLATRKRSYFKEVTILVPKSWPSKPEYQTASFETFVEADVQITKPNPMHADGPYTMQPMPCENPGTYIHLTPNYLRFLSDNSTLAYGDPGKTLVHEWAHLRYGIFDEYPDPATPQFYYDPDFQKYMPNACTNHDLVGQQWNPKEGRECSVNSDNRPEPDCIFIVDAKQNTATSSIASYHHLPSVFTFCDDTEEFLHNKHAPNMHNRMCESRSTWSVILKHEDFKNNKNPAAEIANTVPTFKIVQQEEATFSLVLDISGSMNSPSPHTKLHMLQEAATRWLKEEVKLGSSVGVVTFSNAASLVQPIIKISNEAIRNQVISKIPPSADGGTCIGCGLRTAVADLKRFRKGNGGIIVLLSDGEETTAPYVRDVIAEIAAANIRVIIIAFTAQASAELERLAVATGGKAYFVPTEASVIMLDAAFYAVTTHQSTDEDLSSKVNEERFQKKQTNFEGEFIIDMTIGRDTAVNFLYNDKSDITDITIKGPGVSVSMHTASTDAIKIELNDRQKQVRFVFMQLGPARYKYVVSRRGSLNQDMTVNVASKSKTKGEEAITTDCTVLELKSSNPPQILILTQVRKGTNPVVNARVIAKVDRPNRSSVTIELFDNGRKGDIVANDGTYTGYFTQFFGKGRYSIQANVVANNKTAILETGFTASRAMPIYHTNTVLPNITNVPTGEFERVASAGSIQLTTDLNAETTDLFPPSRITDLRVITVTTDGVAHFQWSAPGDDLDNGQASEYDLRYTMDFPALQTTFYGQRFNGTTPPVPAGEIENQMVELVGLGGDVVYFVAIKTKDKAGHWSELSNIVEIRGY